MNRDEKISLITVFVLGVVLMLVGFLVFGGDIRDALFQGIVEGFKKAIAGK